MGLLTGIAGGLLILGGLAMVFVFPDLTDYQPEGMSKAGILVGLGMIAVGAGLVVFA